MVYFQVAINAQGRAREEWADVAATDSLVEDQLNIIRVRDDHLTITHYHTMISLKSARPLWNKSTPLAGYDLKQPLNMIWYLHCEVSF